MADAPAIILASASRARRAMLEAAGVGVTTVPATVDEAAIRTTMVSTNAAVSPAEIAEALARAKAEAVSRGNPSALVIGADQVLAFGSAVVSKARDPAEARDVLTRLRGKTHELHTAAAIAEGGDTNWVHSETAWLTMRNFSDGFLSDYLARAGDRVCDSVGAYEIEGLGVQLFERVEGNHFTILGLPLLSLLKELRRRGVIAS